MNIDALRITSTKTRAEARAEKEASENANMAKEAKISLLKQTIGFPNSPLSKRRGR